MQITAIDGIIILSISFIFFIAQAIETILKLGLVKQHSFFFVLEIIY